MLLAPFLIFPSPTRALALLGLPFLWTLRWWQKGHFIPRTPFDWSVLGVLVMVLVSLYATFSIDYSLAKLCGILFHIAIFYAVVDTVYSEIGLLRALLLYFSLGLAVVGLGLLGSAWLFKAPILRDLVRLLPPVIQGLPGAETGIHPNQLAGTLIWIFPLQISLLWALRFRPDLAGVPGKLWWPLLFTVCLATIFVFMLTQSRGGWVGGAVAMAFLAAFV